MDLINVYVDTDVVVLLVAFILDFLKINVDAQVIVICDARTQKYCMSINVIAKTITLERCKELLFLHVLLSWSDYTSNFFHVGKVKLWNSWSVNQDLPETFIRLGDWPSLQLIEEDINVIEKFVISLYCDDCNCFSIDLGRYEIFKYRQHMETRDALIQHIHKSAYVSCHIRGRANLTNKTDELPSNWTWSMSSDKILCTCFT